MFAMRTTLTIRDEIAQALKARAYQSGESFKDTVNKILLAGLTASDAPSSAKPYTLKPVRLGSTVLNINLDKTLQLADTLENEEIVKKLHLRK